MVSIFKSFYIIFLGKIIGTIPEECAADAISMVKARNEKIEEREKEKENQKANLYIPSTIGTQMNLVPFLFMGRLSRQGSTEGMRWSFIRGMD